MQEHDAALTSAAMAMRACGGIVEVEQCGAGGQSTSYRARLGSGRVVCIKCAEAESVHLRREATMLSRLTCPSLPRLLFDGVGRGFIVEEYAPGSTLSQAGRDDVRSALPEILESL